MLDADIDSLLEIAVADLLVDDDADGGLGHVVHDARLAVVHFVGHLIEHIHISTLSSRVLSCGGFGLRGEFWSSTYTLLDCAVGFDVDNIAYSVGFHVRAESDHALQTNISLALPLPFPCSIFPLLIVAMIRTFWRKLRLKA